MLTESFRRNFRLAVQGLGICAFAVLVYQQGVSNQIFYADGANDLYQFLVRGNYIPGLWTKYFADFVFRFPLMIASAMGVVSFRVFAWLFGFAHYVHPYVSLVACWFIVRKSNPSLMAFPLISTLISSISASAFMITQAHFTCSLYWPVYLYLIVHPRLTAKDGCWVGLAILCATFTYQTSIVFNFLVLVLFATRYRALARVEKRIAVECAVLIAVILYGVATYPQEENRDAFFHSARLAWLWETPLTYLPVGAGLILLVALLSEPYVSPRGQSSRLLLTAASVFVSYVYIFKFRSSPDLFDPRTHYLGRTLLLHVPALMFLAALIFSRRATPSRLSPPTWFALCAFASVVWLGQWEINRQWRQFYTTFEQETAGDRGFVNYEDTSLAKTPSLQKFVWPWTNVYLSVMIGASARREIATFIKTPRYETYSPLKAEHLRQVDLTRYGVRIRF